MTALPNDALCLLALAAAWVLLVLAPEVRS